VTDFEAAARPHVEALLEPDEELRGICAATQSKLFSGRMVALAATDRRLIVLPLTRSIAPDGEALSLPRDRIAHARTAAGGAGAVQLRLRTADGQKLKLIMMRGDGPLGGLGGGEAQARGVDAVQAFLA
jgi:hypothetical protein